MGSDFDSRLAAFGPRDVTVVGTNALLKALPHVQPLPPVASMAEVVAAVAGGAPPSVLARAEALVAEEASNQALWLVTGLDAGDGIITVFSSLRSALALYLGRKGRSTKPPPAWSAHQAGDAVLKAVAIGHLLELCFPDSDDPLADLARIPAGRALLSYFAAAEVALPFVDAVVAGTHALTDLLPTHGDAQARKLSAIIGREAVQRAREHLPVVAPAADALVAHTAGKLGPLASAAQARTGGSQGLVDRVGDVVAAGADVLPVYRFLGLRVVAEAAALRAAREAGVAPADPAVEQWVHTFVLEPRQVADPLAPSLTATGWADEDREDDDTAAVVEDGASAAPHIPAPGDPVIPAPGAPVIPAPGAPVIPAPGDLVVPPSGELDGAPVVPPPLPASHRASTSPVPPTAAATAPPPTPGAVAPPPAGQAAPQSSPPPLPIEGPSQGAKVPPPLPVDGPSQAAPVASPVRPGGEPSPPPLPSAATPSPVPSPSRAAAPPKTPTPPTSSPEPKASLPTGKKSPGPSSPVTPKPPPKPSAAAPAPPAPAGGGGLSIMAIGLVVGLVLLLGCGGVLAIGGVGAVAWNTHDATTPDPPKKKTGSTKKTSSKQKSGSAKKSGATKGKSKRPLGKRRSKSGRSR